MEVAEGSLRGECVQRDGLGNVRFETVHDPAEALAIQDVAQGVRPRDGTRPRDDVGVWGHDGSVTKIARECNQGRSRVAAGAYPVTSSK